jgi:hypothetical protein
MVNLHTINELKKSGKTMDHENKVRLCLKCGETKSFDDFHFNGTRKIPRSVCKVCQSIADKEDYRKNKEARLKKYHDLSPDEKTKLGRSQYKKKKEKQKQLDKKLK